MVSQASHDGLEFWKFMVAGSIAGSVEHMAMFPVDTLKTRMQAITSSSSSSHKSRPSKTTLRQSFGLIMKVEGLGGFYRGIGAMGLGAGPAHAVYFSVYESCKKKLGDPNNSLVHAASGVFATVASDAVITPMDVVKQRLQLEGSPYKGVGDCVKRVLVEEGFGALYASYRTTILMNAPFTAVHFATYEAVKRGLLLVEDSHEEETLVVHATAGAAAGALAAGVTTPLDVVKTQLQCQGVCGCDRFTSSSSIGDVVKEIVKKDGGYVGGLMRGWIPRMMFHAPAAAICWSTYESLKHFFQQLNHGQQH